MSLSMHFQVIILVSSLFFLSSCGDPGSSNAKPPVETVNPSIVTDDYLISGINRDRGIPLITYAQEIERAIQEITSPSYRVVPDMEKDDEGRDGSNVLSRTHLGRPQTSCGLLPGVGKDARIKECAKLNPTSSSWDGMAYGTSTEGKWTLMAVTESKQELWIDTRTGMIWSGIVASGNWCQASGNLQKPSALGITFDCSDEDINQNKNYCIELTIPGIDTEVEWRLPTRNDFLQADINGLRLVLSKGNGVGFWTATMDASSEERNRAWVYNQVEANLMVEELQTVRNIRCIGISKK